MLSSHTEPILPLKPTGAADRYIALDVLRGFALLGVLLVNAVTFFRISLFEQIMTFHTDPGWVNHVVDVLVAGLLEFKAVTLFSWLFGVGVGVQTERVGARGRNTRGFLVRRFLVLLVFGLCHLFLISNVDVLTLYAVCGLLLVPFIELPATALAGLGVLLIALSFVLPFGAILPSEAMMRTQGALATHLYATGSYPDILRFRWQETWHFIFPLLVYILPRTLGLMLLGMATWRAGVLQQPARHRKLLLVIVVGAGLMGGVATGLQVFSQSSGHDLIAGLPPKLLDAGSYMPLALAYAAALLLWLSFIQPGAGLISVAALGQMALTNYLVQSVVLSLIFYGYGAGLCGRLGSAPTLLLGLMIYGVQLLASRAWLAHYRFGPFEWVWRSLTYGQRQPMRRLERLGGGDL
ncbi:MAG: DUF418 domain-containing protein [Abitibacteriaceae bacterium]|nr:DUF418 domain-containing protein [Abditibacteriaceae bacterium]